jgi:hypothetical protein
MLRAASLLVTAVLCGALASCRPPALNDAGEQALAPGRSLIPGPDEVSAVVVKVEGWPVNKELFPGAPFELRLTRREDVAELLDWLKGFDWSRPGKDMKAMKLALMGSIVIERIAGPPLRFYYTWDAVIHDNGLRGADTTRLKEIIRRVRGEG